MPRDTKIWIGIYAAVIIAMMFGIWAGPNNGLRQNLYAIKGACEFAILGFLSVWAVLSAPPRRGKFAVVAALVVAMVFGELSGPMRISFADLLAPFTGLSMLATGSALSACYFAIKGFGIIHPANDPRPTNPAPLRFSLREIFALTLLCAIFLAMRPLLGVDWSDVQNVLPIAFIFAPFGLISIAAAWAMLMPRRLWLRIPLGLSTCAIPWLAFAYYLSITTGNTEESLSFLKYLVGYYAASLLLYATLRKSGFRLLQLTNQNETPAPSTPPAATDPVTL